MLIFSIIVASTIIGFAAGLHLACVLFSSKR